MKRTLFLVVVLLSACSHTPKKIVSPTGMKPAQFWEDQGRRAAETKLISGKIRLSYRGKSQNMSGQGRMLAQLPNQALLELRDPLGRVAYLAALEGKDFTAYYPRQKEAYVEKDGGSDYLRRFLGLHASFGDLQRILVGLAPSAVARGPFQTWDWDADRGQYRGRVKTTDRTYHFYVDPNSGVLREAEVFLPGETIHVTYSDFESCCGEVGRSSAKTEIPVGLTVKVEMEKAETSVEVEWQEIRRLDKARGADAFRVSLPNDVKRIPLTAGE